MTHASLFSGIGGFNLAARKCGIRNIFDVEINEFCQKVLEKNFPETIKYRDIKKFNGTEYYGTIDIVSGGFPCQPFSVAGKRKGTEDDRYLWAEMLRVITEVGPTWVIAENVPGLLTIGDGMVFEQCLADLEAAGYEVEAFNIPAISVDAPHRRERIWIVAHADYLRHERTPRETLREWQNSELSDTELSGRSVAGDVVSGGNCNAESSECIAHSDVYGNRRRQRANSEADGIPQFGRQTVCSGMPCRANQALNITNSENCGCGGRIGEECAVERAGNISPTECPRRLLGREVEGCSRESAEYNSNSAKLRLYGRNASSEAKHGQAEIRPTEALNGMPTNSDSQRELQPQGIVGEEWRRTEYSNPTIENNITNANCTGLQSPRTEFATAGTAGDDFPPREIGWDTHWFEVATELCRVDDGLPNRVDRIKSLGNAIVPQVAEKIFRAILYAESEIN